MKTGSIVDAPFTDETLAGIGLTSGDSGTYARRGFLVRESPVPTLPSLIGYGHRMWARIRPTNLGGGDRPVEPSQGEWRVFTGTSVDSGPRRQLRILWVRHSPKLPGRVTRDNFLVPRLARRHYIEVVTWNSRESAGTLGLLKFGSHSEDGVRTWIVPRLPRIPGWPAWRTSVGQPLFRAALRWISRRMRPDVVVVGPSWTQVGVPPRLSALCVFDYLDGSDWSHPKWRASELALLDWADGAICVSEALASRARLLGKPCATVPNGVDLEAFAGLRAQRDHIRSELGLVDRKVVTLIGLTAADDDYWVESVRLLAAKVPGFLFAAVGSGSLAGRLRSLERALPAQVRFVGPVPYEEAKRWFVASDVTWYPGMDIEYFHVASPLKVFEGLAAGAQVLVAPRLRSLESLETPALHFSAPTTDAFTMSTQQLLSSTAAVPARLDVLAPYSWDRLSDDLATFLESLADRRRVGGAGRDS